MILNYSVKNFYSIGSERAMVNFEVDGNAPKTTMYAETNELAGRASLIETVIGPNASGKTHLLQGLAFIHHLLVASYSDDPKAPMYLEPHMGLADIPTEVSTKFTIEDRVFKYSFKLTKNRILTEHLREYSRVTERARWKVLSSREWDESAKKYTLHDKVLGIDSVKQLRQNASMLATVMQMNAPSDLAWMIADYWSSSVVVHNLWVKGNREDHDNGNRLLHRKMREVLHENNTALLASVSSLLKDYDIGFHDFEEQVVNLLDGDSFSKYYVKHLFNGTEFSTDIEMESSGTKRLISILVSMLRVLSLKKGGIAIVDEIDAYLHPNIVEALVDLFVHPETNPHKAQLLFSTHHHRLLQSFDKQQIILAEKNDNGMTEVWRLDDVDGVDSRDNYYTKYITGAYDARPRLGM